MIEGDESTDSERSDCPERVSSGGMAMVKAEPPGGGLKTAPTSLDITRSATDPKCVTTMARLTAMELRVTALPDCKERPILEREIREARRRLTAGDPSYADALQRGLRRRLAWLYLRSLLWPYETDCTIQLVVRGMAVYSAIVLLIFGPLVVIVVACKSPNPPAILDRVPLIPQLVETANSLGIRPIAYLWGLFGGAGAVCSLARRFEAIATRKAPIWYFYSLGLFNPIVGSLSGVIAGHLMPQGSGTAIAAAFAAGFSERFLDRLETPAAGNQPSRA